jgi:hypothetical protein
VTGVDRNGLEWTGVDIFSAKSFLTQSGWEDEGWKTTERRGGILSGMQEDRKGGRGGEMKIGKCKVQNGIARAH